MSLNIKGPETHACDEIDTVSRIFQASRIVRDATVNHIFIYYSYTACKYIESEYGVLVCNEQITEVPPVLTPTLPSVNSLLGHSTSMVKFAGTLGRT